MLEQQLSQFGSVPVSHSDLHTLLVNFRGPNDKIAEWLRQGVLLSVRRGLYVVGAPWRNGPVGLPLVANRLHGPSCVSLDYALAWHGLIPERVHELTSVCVRRARTVENALGRFSYATLPSSIYPIGIQQINLSPQMTCLMASPAKALCDTVLLTRLKRLTSRSAMREFLFDDLRIDETTLSNLDLTVVAQYISANYKVPQLQALEHILAEFQ